MKQKAYLLEFYYATDLRWEVKVNANDEGSALIIAMNQDDNIKNWTEGSDKFFIKIKQIAS